MTRIFINDGAVHDPRFIADREMLFRVITEEAADHGPRLHQ